MIQSKVLLRHFRFVTLNVYARKPNLLNTQKRREGRGPYVQFRACVGLCEKFQKAKSN